MSNSNNLIPPSRPRNHLVPAAKFRKAGAHNNRKKHAKQQHPTEKDFQ